MNFKKPEPLFAVLMLVAFFLPWVSIGGLIKVSGYDIPSLYDGLQKLAAAFTEEEMSTPPGIYAVYLIPVAALGILVLEAMGRPSKALAIIGGLVPYGGLVYALASAGSEIFETMAIGAYLTLVAGAGLLLAGTGILKFSGSSNGGA